MTASPEAGNGRVGIALVVANGPGVLHQLTGVIAARSGDITSVEIAERRADDSDVYFEVELPEPPADLLAELRAHKLVRKAEVVQTFHKVFGKRIISLRTALAGRPARAVTLGELSPAGARCV